MTRPGAGFIVANTLLLWAATALAAWSFWPINQDRSFLVMAAVTTVLGSAVAILGAVLRWRAHVVLLVGFGVFLLAGVPLAVPGRAASGILPTLEGLRELVAGVALGWKQLLTITLPVGDYQALLVPAYALLLTSTIVSLSVALRARWGELAVLGPIGISLAGIAFGPQTVPWPVPAALGLLAVVLLWLVWRRLHRRREAIRRLSQAADSTRSDGGSGWRTVLAGGLLLAVAAAASIGATVVLPPAGERMVLRTAIDQPFDARDHPSPLSGLRRYLQPDRVDTVMFTVSGLPRNARIRIASLDSYDGVVYSVGGARAESASGSFVRIPTGVDRSGVAGERVELDVTIRAYRDVWLPTMGTLASVGFEGGRSAGLRDGFYDNETTGTAAVVGGLRAGDEYRLDAIIPGQPTEGQLAQATPGSAEVPRLAELPAELALALDAYIDGVADPGQRLVAAIQGLRRDGYISHGLDPDEPASRSGHSADRITELFTAPRMIGDAEQYAVAAALMARQLGFPARVVFGFVPEGSGEVSVRGGDVSAWIEVSTAEYGWVTIDPVPEERPIPEEEPEDPVQVARPQSIVPPPPDRADAGQDQSAPDSERDLPAHLDPVLQAVLAVLRVAGLVLAVAGVLTAPFLFIVAAKLRRRRLRRLAPEPLQRIRGGWDEFADTVVDHGYAPPAAATRSELAGVVGTLPSRVLAAVADRAVFAPEAPDPVDADHVWDAVRELRAVLDGNTNRRGRVKALISLRSLGGYSVRNLIKGTRE